MISGYTKTIECKCGKKLKRYMAYDSMCRECYHEAGGEFILVQEKIMEMLGEVIDILHEIDFNTSK